VTPNQREKLEARAEAYQEASDHLNHTRNEDGLSGAEKLAWTEVAAIFQVTAIRLTQRAAAPSQNQMNTRRPKQATRRAAK